MATELQAGKNYSLTNLPSSDNADAVGKFFHALYEDAIKERRRLELEDRWNENHRLFRANHWRNLNIHKRRDRQKITINLMFANTQRTVANITAKNPVVEVVSMDGVEDDADTLITNWAKSWWTNTEQATSLTRSALACEIYGITTEKAVFNADTGRPHSVVLDPFAYLPAPGYYEELNDAPYHCHLSALSCSQVENMFDLEQGAVKADNVYSILGEDREENRVAPHGTRYGSMNYPSNYVPTEHPLRGPDYRIPRALVVEIWIRDHSVVTTNEFSVDPATGEEVVVNTTKPKYPGGIRVVTITNGGNLVLGDRVNPNINPALPLELASKTYLFDHFPFYKVNSYEDTTSIWGFSIAEQVGDLNKKIDEILTRIAQYIARVTMPPLIVPLDTGITKEMITNQAGLILQPTNSGLSQGIRYLQVPNLPRNFFELLEIYVKFFDRVYQIEDADRGEVPNRIVSGAAISALQERGAVLIRAKIRSVDYLVRMRGRCAISFLQNFGVAPESVDVQGTAKVLQGVAYAGREFNFIVESGSTVAKTSLQVQEQAVELYKLGAIDRQALLENLNFPNWKAIVERSGEGQLAQALAILVQAGMPQDVAQQLGQQLMASQGGPGSTTQQPQGAAGNSPGMPDPKTEQGQAPNAPL